MEGGHDLECQALLILEDYNAYDSNAVRVEIRGRKVGYLSREDAARLRAAIPADRRKAAVHCAAKINGGFDDDGDLGHFGVRLGLPRYGQIEFA
ncbi:hypothetical protein Q0812_13235 [Brevundimonas sp. 2R-24]|uniref:HIRAN domain-containing protein n=1 Tax=Peiella sedimenti TaxID=3061083 RepID=A0ABT8SRR4_9CAUL|nr:hypothetical protein [Caulobacteraceae bacterium XZ-24]